MVVSSTSSRARETSLGQSISLGIVLGDELDYCLANPVILPIELVYGFSNSSLVSK